MNSEFKPTFDLSVVVPMYNEVDNVETLLTALRATLDEMGVNYEMILVDDGSTDGTWAAIEAAAPGDHRLRGISLSRNFGHQNALFAGLHHVSGAAVISMDGDLQHPPQLIPRLYEAWLAGNMIVETQRSESRDASTFKRVTSRWFYKVFSAMSGLPISKGTSDFRLMDQHVVEIVTDMKDTELFLRGIAHWVGFARTTIPYQAVSRHAGESKYNLFRMFKFAMASVISFSTIPLKMGVWIGMLTSVLAFSELVYILIMHFRGNAVPGWTSTLAVISFMFGILFIMLGVLGVYLGSIFETMKNRPRFLVGDSTGFENE